MFAFVLDDLDRIVVAIEKRVILFGNGSIEFLEQITIRQRLDRNFGLQMHAVFSGDDTFTPFDFKVRIVFRQQRVVPAKPQFAPRTVSIDIRPGGRKSRAIKVDAAHRRNGLVVNLPATVDSQMTS